MKNGVIFRLKQENQRTPQESEAKPSGVQRGSEKRKDSSNESER